MSEFRNSSLRTGRFNCRLMTEYKLRSDAGFICDKTPAKFSVLKLEIEDTFLIPQIALVNR